MMGGRIWIESEVGVGSTFHFTAVFARPGNVPAMRDATPVKLHDLPVLVVDDNATNRRILQEVLTNWRMRVTVVDGARAALVTLERARESGEPFSLVLIDGHMPGMDGFTLAERIQQDPHLATTTLVMLTSGGQAGDVARCRQLGIASYLLKPIKQSDLLRTLVSALRLAIQGDRRPDANAAPSQKSHQSLHVLLAEDNLVNQRLAVRLLEKRGHAVTVAGNGREALTALEKQGFDLVLMDVEMPEMGGFEATAAIREKEQGTGRHIPIVAMTAHAMKGDRERCLAAGMDGYVSKPIQAHELWQVMEELVSRRLAGETLPTPDPIEAVLDRATALKRVGGDRQLLAEIVQLFVSQCPRWLADIRLAVAQGDAILLYRTAHTLKGAVGNFGAAEACLEAQRLERLGREGNLKEAADICTALERQIERLLPALNALTREEVPPRS
jgi:CheY-like chemotaxis protein